MKMPVYSLAPGVEDEIQRLFEPRDAAYVQSKLVATKLPREELAPPPRVHMAVLWLSGGDRKRFDTELERACCDWRDTLMAAGLANADWREVIKAKGIELGDRRETDEVHTLHHGAGGAVHRGPLCQRRLRQLLLES